jgi:hypothetical protein
VEGVALHLHLNAAVGSESLAEEAAVTLERAHVVVLPEFLQQPCGALDVGEQQRDRAARKLRHGQTVQAYGGAAPATSVVSLSQP